jgi:pilus assembly protein CpaC
MSIAPARLPLSGPPGRAAWLAALFVCCGVLLAARHAAAQAPMPPNETAPIPRVVPGRSAPQPVGPPAPAAAPQTGPAAAAQPAPPPGAGPRLSDLIGGVHPRLEGLPAGVLPPLGTTPVPGPEVQQKFDRFVGGFRDPENTIELIVGRPRIWFLKAVPVRIQVGDDKVLSYTSIGKEPRELSLIGQAVGTTVLNLWFGDADDPATQTILSFLVQVLPDPEAKERLERVYKALEDEINRAFPDAHVILFLVGDKIVITGQAKDANEATAILQIVRANAPGGNNANANNGVANIPVNQALLNLGATGVGPNGQLRQALENYIIQGETNIVNLLRIPGEQQVMLKVTVAEINRTAARSLGLNAAVSNKAGMTVFNQSTGAPLAANLTGLIDAGRIMLAIEALRSVNLARSLAEPNLVTLNGEPAAFQAGGQFPVPIVTGATATGLQGVSFVPFGVLLNFVPYIADKDKIRLQLQAVVSVRDPSIGTNFNQSLNQSNTTFVPGLNTRNVQTTVELREGQTLAIAGLLQTNLGAQTTRLPGLGDIPFGGQLFRVDRTQAGESELVILITPELVHPLEPKEIPPLPGSDYFEPGDLEFYLLGRQESGRSYDYRSTVMNDVERMKAYRRCELLYFVGPHGHSQPK